MTEFIGWNSPTKGLRLEGGEIHVWKAWLDCGVEPLRRLEATLCTAEIARAERFFEKRDRNGFVAARGILREILGRYIGRPAGELEFDYSERGKPSVRAEKGRESVEFNVSHSGGIGLFAFAARGSVGVDVEKIRPGVSNIEIAERYFSPQEVKELQALAPALRNEAFFLCWTRKEAYIKARGEGLHIPLESFSVSLTPGAPEALVSEDSTNWKLQSLSVAEEYVGALVGAGQDWQARFWSWSSELAS